MSTIGLKGEELITYLMKRFNWTREQAHASVRKAQNFRLF